MSHPTPPNVVRPRQQPSRRKIEYLPLAREVDTYGGRDLKLIENEYVNTNGRRIREINEWGPIDIEHLTLSIRSRLSTELSWGLTAFSLLSTMRGQQPGSGFPIMNCPDLLEEILDLAEDLAFDGPESQPDDQLFREPLEIRTHRQLTNIVLERHLQPFAALENHQGSKNSAIGPMQRPANYVLAVVNIIRNLSTVNDNIQWLSRHERAIDLLLRLGTIVIKDGVPTPASPTLSLSDLVEIRKDTIYTLSALAEHIPVPPTNPLSKEVLRMARRTIDLAASYLVDPVDAVSPLACVQRAGHPLNPHIRPPLFTDMALELLVHFIMPDANRQAVAKSVPSSSLWTLFEALVHRMPVIDSDFQMMVQEVWLSHIHDLTMAIYSLVFLAPPLLKQRMRTDRRLGFKNVMLRLLQRFLTTQDGRARFYLTARRIVETLKALDDSVDPFENPVDSSAPALSFGMGFADSNDSGQEKGTGLLGAHRDLGWEILNTREVQGDDLMFRELESLVRIECQ
jgi:SWI/SNF chromatin-remodeling complex subunit SWI1